MTPTYDYAAVYATSKKVTWEVEDLIGDDLRLDFDRPFMPESLALSQIPFLSSSEQRVLNQLRGHNYLHLFGLVEEFIVPFVLQHVEAPPQRDDYRTRALMQFASEETKHIHLFKRFREEFLADFGHECPVIGPAEDIAKAVLAHHPLGVGLCILHIEWMTQRHWLDSIKDDSGLDDRFVELLRNHWMEEAQHAKLDTNLVEAMAAEMTAEEIGKGIAAYAEIGALLDGGLQAQVDLDLATFQEVIGRKLSDAELKELKDIQVRAMRWTFLGSGMTHPKFLSCLGSISPEGRAQVEQMAPAFC